MRNLRAYLDAIGEQGHLKSIEWEVDWSIEASALTATSCREVGPALHFKNVKDYPEGFSLVGGLFAGPGTLYLEEFTYWTRLCIALGLDSHTDYADFLQACTDRLDHPILPMRVDHGPVKDVVATGEDVDIADLPFPLLHQKDGGRHGTLQTLVVRDLDSDRTVWENVRTMLVDQQRLAVHLEENSEARKILDKHEAADKPMPFALVLGGSPAVTMTGFLPLPSSDDPAALAGGLNLDPIELVKAETSDLLVPAEAEVVLEGRVQPGETILAGPFPNYWIYRERQQQPVLRVSTITRRTDPIFPFSVDGVKPSDTHALKSLMLSRELYDKIRKERNFPVQWVQLPIEFNLNVVLVCTPILFPGYVGMLSKYVLSLSRRFGSLWNKVIVVDEKTPAHSLEETIATLIQRANPRRSYHVWDNVPIGPNARYASAEQLADGTTSGMYVDTAWPNDWPKDEFPRKCDLEGSFPEAMIRDVVKRYNALGFQGRPVVFKQALVPF